MKSLVSLLLCLILAGGAAFAQFPPNCPNGRCPLVPTRVVPVAVPVVAAPAVPLVECEQTENDPATLWRFKVDGREVGTLNEATGLFEAANGKRWRFALPAAGKVSADPPGVNLVGQIPPGGIEPDKVCPDGEGGFSRNGERCTKRSAFQSLLGGGTASGLPDDSGLLRLTVIGPDADRARVVADIESNAALADLRASVLVTNYAPDSWAVAGLGFKTDGKPTIYIQNPGGTVIHRQDDYDGPERLAGAIRKAKAYDPSKDKDLRKDDPVKPAPDPAQPTQKPVPVDPVKPDAPQPSPAPFKLPEGGLLLVIGAAIAWLFQNVLRKPAA